MSGVLEILGIIVTGIGRFFGKVWDVSKDLITQFFLMLPKPLKFFMFLFMTLFLVSIIMPVFLGIGYTCDTKGNSYSINFVDILVKTEYVDNLANICGVSSTETSVTQLPTFSSMLTSFVNWYKSIFSVPAFWNIYHARLVGENGTAVDNQICDDFKNAVLQNGTTNRDFVLSEFGVPTDSTNYKQLVHVGCAQRKDGTYYTTLKFFDLDIFNFELWLLLGIIGMLTPFMLKWYNFVFKR